MKNSCPLLAAALISSFVTTASGQSPGALDTSFESGSFLNDVVCTLAPAGSGKFYIGGDFTVVRGASRNRIARLNSGGTPDSGFDPGIGANGSVNSVAVQADGRVLIGGAFTSYQGTMRIFIARLDNNGTLDTTFDPGSGANNWVHSVVVQADGKVLIGGGFTGYNDISRPGIARLNSNGSLDTTFNPGSGASTTWVYSVAIQPDGKILIGGLFTSYNGTDRNRIARLNSDGSLDTSFNPGSGANAPVYAVGVQADGKVLLGGAFTSYNGTGRNSIARLNSDGSLDTTFNPGAGANAQVQSVALQADGKMLIGGLFTTYNGTNRSRIARLNSDGSLDTTFNPGAGANASVQSAALQADGKVLITGAFTAYNGVAQSCLARLHNDAASQTLAVTSRSRVEWLRGGSAAEVAQVTFDYSANGTDWTPLGSATRAGALWELAGLNLPAMGHLRARGRATGGFYNGSSGIIEQTAAFAIASSPDVATSAAEPFGAAATLHGTVNPNGSASTAQFEYGTTTSYGSTALVTLAPNDGTTPQAVSTVVTGLALGTTYHYRLTAFNANGSSTSPDATFKIAGPAPVSFAAPIITLVRGAASVQLTVVRPSGDFAATVNVSTSNGTAQAMPPFAAARVGIDFMPLATPARTVTFGVGETEKTVLVTLSTQPVVPNRRFTVTLSNPSAEASLGAITTVTIQILGSDTTKPTLAVTAPVAGTETVPVPAVSSPSPFLIKGTAGDANGLDRVEVALNGAAPMAATLGAAAVPTSVPWSLPVSPLPGENTAVVTAYDLLGNSTSVTRIFDFTRRYVLTLNRTGPPGVELDSSGTLVQAATPAVNASALTPAVAGANPRTSTIVPGTMVKLTATPKGGFVFGYWSGAPTGATYAGNVISFTMPQGDVGPITASFVANPFFGPPGSSDTFYGIIRDTSSGAAPAFAHGFLTGTMMPETGVFSGKLLIAGLTKSFVAYFYGDGSAAFNATRDAKLIFDGSRTLDLAFQAGKIQATINDAAPGDGSPTGMAPIGESSFSTAERGIYSDARSTPGALLNQKIPGTAASNNRGFFTLSLPAKVQTPPRSQATFPQGDGFGTITLSDNGTLTLAGTLADGTTFTSASGVVSGDAAPVFAQLATPGGAAPPKSGAFLGALVFDATQTNSDVSGSNLAWFRPEVTEVSNPILAAANPAAAAARALYTAGWPNGIYVDAVGALYDNSLTAQESLGIGPANMVSGNALLMMIGGKLTAPVTKTNFNIVDNKITKIPAADASFTLLVVPSTGAFSGTFTPNWANQEKVKPGFKGILLQKGANRGGFGHFISNAKNDNDPESGGVTLSGP